MGWKAFVGLKGYSRDVLTGRKGLVHGMENILEKGSWDGKGVFGMFHGMERIHGMENRKGLWDGTGSWDD